MCGRVLHTNYSDGNRSLKKLHYSCPPLLSTVDSMNDFSKPKTRQVEVRSKCPDQIESVQCLSLENKFN